MPGALIAVGLSACAGRSPVPRAGPDNAANVVATPGDVRVLRLPAQLLERYDGESRVLSMYSTRHGRVFEMEVPRALELEAAVSGERLPWQTFFVVNGRLYGRGTDPIDIPHDRIREIQVVKVGFDVAGGRTGAGFMFITTLP